MVDKVNILIVDDEPGIREVIEEYLKLHGFQGRRPTRMAPRFAPAPLSRRPIFSCLISLRRARMVWRSRRWLRGSGRYLDSSKFIRF